MPPFVSKDGAAVWPDPGQQVYLLLRNDDPVGVALHFPAVVAEIQRYPENDRPDFSFKGIPWLG